MDKRKNNNVLKRKGFVVTDITNNESLNGLNNRVNALKKNRFIVKNIYSSDNESKKCKRREQSEHIIGKEVIKNDIEVLGDNVKTELNNSFEDITDCQVINSEDNNLSVKCQVISEQCYDESNRICVKISIDNLLRNRVTHCVISIETITVQFSLNLE